MNENKLKSWFWFLLDVAIACWVIGFLFVGLPALQRIGNSFSSGRNITVTAEGKALAAPDLAELSFSVVSQGKNPEELSENNNQKMTAATKFVKGEGVLEKDMKTTSYSLQPNYQYNPTTQRNFITGYTLTQTLTIKVHDLNKVAKIIAGLTPLGVNQIGGVNFSIENENTVLSEARNDAFKKAKAKAEEMAKAAGTTLGRVINVSESSSGPIPYYAAAPMMEKFGRGAGPTPAPVEPGTSEVKLNVQIVYELR